MRNKNLDRTTHGMCGTKTYSAWRGMLDRCSEKYHFNEYYFKKGIKVCDRWLKFEFFFEDMGLKPDGLSLDRIDGSLGYSKENCRWASSKQQVLNRGLFKSNKTGFRGITEDKRMTAKRWRTVICHNNKRIHVGFFKTKEEAAKAYDEKAIELFGEDAVLNFNEKTKSI